MDVKDFIQPILDCMKAEGSLNMPGLPEPPKIKGKLPSIPINFTFPEIGKPGLPCMLKGSFMSMTVGINYALDILKNLPSVPELPTFKGIFWPPIKAAIGPGLPLNFPSFNIGYGVTLPGMGNINVPDWNIQGQFNIIKVILTAPFEICLQFIKDIIAKLGVPPLPTLNFIKQKIMDIALPAFKTIQLPAGTGGLSGPPLPETPAWVGIFMGFFKMLGCLAKAIKNLFTLSF